MPSFLGSQEFFKKNIERFILDENLDEQFAVSYLRQKTRPFILRRTKAQVEKDLPPKIESTLPVNLTSTQRELYNQTLEEVRPLVFGAIEKRGIKGASVHILAALMRLRQICNHPNSLAALRNVPGYDSGKFNLLRDIVPQALDSGRKILLFSQFREMLSIIRRWLDDKKFNGQKAQYLYLDGHTRDRQSLIDRFNSDEEIRLFLISLKAGGTGLNLTAADTVIIYDPWWNPAVEDQAVDRAHRIGQTKAVSVYRLVTEHTIEKKIMGLKEKKSKIVDSLVNESALAGLNLSRKDLENLFTPLPADN
jgi:non-specific serine/threonine protein kinase